MFCIFIVTTIYSDNVHCILSEVPFYGKRFNELASQFVKVIAGLDRNREHFNKFAGQFAKRAYCLDWNSTRFHKLARQFVKVLAVSVESGNHFNKLAGQFVKVIAGLDRNGEHFNTLTSKFQTFALKMSRFSWVASLSFVVFSSLSPVLCFLSSSPSSFFLSLLITCFLSSCFLLSFFRGFATQSNGDSFSVTRDTRNCEYIWNKSKKSNENQIKSKKITAIPWTSEKIN